MLPLLPFPTQRPISRDNVEPMLDAGELYIQMRYGRWWRLRRNGKTKTWKKNPQRFRIPVKFGLKFYGAIDDSDLNGEHFDSFHIRHISDIPDELRA